MQRFKAKDSEIKPYSLCLENISKYFTVDNMKKSNTGLNGKVYDFPVSYETISISDIEDIHKYLMIKQCFIINA